MQSVSSGKEDIALCGVAAAYMQDDKLCFDVVNAAIAITASML